ncbi:MAG: hypothetical protein OEV89_04005 [Desulfobulbaceae bacterium]|nr:hypothetical protein [Desulfobulbaceae bacterium]HIJ89908.1 hypothetical protein [Deltaproteobacteria bacterium]
MSKFHFRCLSKKVNICYRQVLWQSRYVRDINALRYWSFVLLLAHGVFCKNIFPRFAEVFGFHSYEEKKYPSYAPFSFRAFSFFGAGQSADGAEKQRKSKVPGDTRHR